MTSQRSTPCWNTNQRGGAAAGRGGAAAGRGGAGRGGAGRGGAGRRRRTAGDKHDEVNRAPYVRRVDRRVQHLAAQPQPQPSAGYMFRSGAQGWQRVVAAETSARQAGSARHRRGRLATPHGRPYLIPILAREHLTHGRPTRSRLRQRRRHVAVGPCESQRSVRSLLRARCTNRRHPEWAAHAA